MVGDFGAHDQSISAWKQLAHVATEMRNGGFLDSNI